MKQKRSGFAAGVLTTVAIGSLGITALAATGQLTITVDPINIQVNGATFQPKDAQGQDVPVFAYNGTTYAPLRALAEAYGLEVGYDAEQNMATVGEGSISAPPETTPVASTPDYSDWTAEEEAAYQEFKGMWDVEDNVDEGAIGVTIIAEYNRAINKDQFIEYLTTTGEELFSKLGNRFFDEITKNYSHKKIYVGFCYSSSVFAGYMINRSSDQTVHIEIDIEYLIKFLPG